MRSILRLIAALVADVLDPAARVPLTPWTVLAALLALYRGALLCERPGGGYSATLWLDGLEVEVAHHHGRTLALSAVARAT